MPYFELILGKYAKITNSQRVDIRIIRLLGTKACEVRVHATLGLLVVLWYFGMLFGPEKVIYNDLYDFVHRIFEHWYIVLQI